MNFKKSLLSRFRAQKQAKPPESAVCQRLLEECMYLERLELHRSALEDSTFGRIIEERIIWRELLDLELQNVDEQIERICETAMSRTSASASAVNFRAPDVADRCRASMKSRVLAS